jgi:hypothetical protein
MMMPSKRCATLAALSLAMLGSGVARADLGPWPRHHDRPPIEAPCSIVPVSTVESVTIGVRISRPIIVAKATAPTAGWTELALRFRSVTGRGTRRATAVYELVGCRPVIAADVLSPVTAQISLGQVRQDGTIHHILVKAEHNSAVLDLDAGPRR